MNLIDEVRKSLAEVHENSAMTLKLLQGREKAWILRKDGWYGVGVSNYYEKEISERFSNVRIWSQKLKIDGEEKNLLLLTSNAEYLRYEFATVCAEFIDPGVDGEMRENLITNPEIWWEKWRLLLGNSVQNKMPYSILGEMLVYRYLVKSGEIVKWAALENATHDIETKSKSYEVKSTVKRYDSVITVNSQHQLVQPKEGLNLCFCRFEESLFGESIEDVLLEIAQILGNYSQLDGALEKMGFEKGCIARSKRYKLHEARLYEVNDHFPRVTADSFIEGRLPEGITRIVYDVDLNGLEFGILNVSE